MPYIEWSDSYSVDIEEMDKQHKQLLDIINEFDEAAEKKEEKNILNKTLEALLDYSDTHFKKEEELLEQHEYPKIEEHKMRHRELVEGVCQIAIKVKEGDKDAPYQIAFLLGDWLLNHLAKEDKLYGIYLNSKGVT
tara:strand:+ start:310 stop:717 length:408 start_codon:yes stop_codon:yes gene_type:complete